MELTPKGRPYINQPAFDKIKKMRGATIVITKKEWNHSRPPGAYILRKRIGGEYIVRTLADRSGWLIKKI